MHRFFVSPDRVTESALTIDRPAEIHHVQDVLRLGLGDEVVCFDGQGSEYTGVILRVAADRIDVKILTRRHESVGAVSVWLMVGIPKGPRFEWLLQKATELGASRISPLLTERTVVRLHDERGRGKRERWQRIAQEAAKQCGRASLPQIDAPQPFGAALPSIAASSLVLIPTLEVTGIPLHELLAQPLRGAREAPSRTILAGEVSRAREAREARPREVAVLIGPEGDFSRDEVALAQAHGARPVSLGPLTLRSETAAIAMVAILQHRFGAL